MSKTEEELYGDTLGEGALVDDWLIDSLRQVGGFAGLYRGRHVRTGVPAAVKVLHRELAVSTRMIRRFQQEAVVLQQIDHPNIVEILQVGTLFDGRPYIAMEWIDGHDLEHELRARGPLLVTDALAVMEEVGAGLGSAHAAGIIHRDLKTQNVMTMPRDGWFHVKLVDFGIAKLLERPAQGDHIITTKTVLGTPETMAPEQILGQPVDARTDIYALGVMLYRVLTGQLPFIADTPVEVEEMHLHATPPAVSQAVPAAAAVEAVVARCMHKDRTSRFGSIDEMLAALRAAASHRAAGAARVGVYVDIDERARDPDAVDELLEQASEALERAGMSVAITTGTAVLATASPAVAPDALRVARELTTRFGNVRITIHAAPGAEPGDALYRVGEWASDAHGVTVTPAATELLVEPVAPK